MILSDRTILKMLEEGTLSISPFDPKQLQPASFDIRLGNTFSIVDDSSSGIVTMNHEIAYKTIKSDTYLLLPGQFILATTMEYITLPDDLTAFVEGRSSLGRMGLFVQNAGWVDPGFQGEITLELFNANRCAIEPAAGSASWYLQKQTAPRSIPTEENTGAREAPLVPGSLWIRN